MPLDVRTTPPVPGQIIEVNGETLTVGLLFLVTFAVAVAVQQLALVTVTVNVAAWLTIIHWVVAPGAQR